MIRKNDEVDFCGMRRRRAVGATVLKLRFGERNLHKQKRRKNLGCIRRLMCGKADRILKLISAGRAGLHVPNARRGAQTITTVQTRLDRYFSHNLPRGEGAWL